jgi:hypothetical protein
MDKNNIISFIKKEFKEGLLRKKLFPMMTDFGVKDYSETVHSLGINYITAIGRNIEGITAISEYPVDPYGYKSRIAGSVSSVREERGEYICSTDAFRPDSIWFSKHDNKPVLICEFERYEKNWRKDNKLKEKIQNLLIAYHQLGGNIPLILFIYWSYSKDVAGDIDTYISILNNGFKQPGGEYISGINGIKTSYIIYRSIATGDSNNLKLNQWIEAG